MTRSKSYGKIGLFGGSFDPIHFGHIHLALELFELHGLKEVWWLPTSSSPFKTALAAPSDRFKMVQKAVAPIEGFKVLDTEIYKDTPCYTIDTVETLLKEHASPSFPGLALIIGSDLIADLPRWKEIEKLLHRVSLITGIRHAQDIPPLKLSALQHAVAEGLTLTKTIDISSTEIRHRLQNKLYCGHLLPASVLEYIEQKQLYYNI